MIAAAEEFSSAKPKPYKAILWGGLIAGVLDITAAFVNSGIQGRRSPLWVLQSVASGLLGRDSYTGGLPAAALGLVMHFLIATVATTVFFIASRKLNILIRKVVFSGLLYGIAVYLFMYGVVLPLTFHRNFFQPLSAVAIGVFIHMSCVGLPIALIVRRHRE